VQIGTFNKFRFRIVIFIKNWAIIWNWFKPVVILEHWNLIDSDRINLLLTNYIIKRKKKQKSKMN